MFCPESLGKKSARGVLGVRFGREKIRTRSIRNKRNLDTKLIDSPAPRLSLRDQQCNDAPLLRHEHVERAARGPRVHDLDAHALAQKRRTELRSRELLPSTGS